MLFVVSLDPIFTADKTYLWKESPSNKKNRLVIEVAIELVNEMVIDEEKLSFSMTALSQHQYS